MGRNIHTVWTIWTCATVTALYGYKNKKMALDNTSVWNVTQLLILICSVKDLVKLLMFNVTVACVTMSCQQSLSVNTNYNIINVSLFPFNRKWDWGKSNRVCKKPKQSWVLVLSGRAESQKWKHLYVLVCEGVCACLWVIWSINLLKMLMSLHILNQTVPIILTCFLCTLIHKHFLRLLFSAVQQPALFFHEVGL